MALRCALCNCICELGWLVLDHLDMLMKQTYIYPKYKSNFFHDHYSVSGRRRFINTLLLQKQVNIHSATN
jgi:hypothetical protein